MLFSNVSETLKIISLTLEDKNNFVWISYHLGCVEKRTMWYKIVRGKSIVKMCYPCILSRKN